MGKTIKKVICTLLFLTLCTSTVLLAYLHFFAPDEENLSGAWITQMDMKAQAAVTALDWLQDIEAISLSLEEMEAYLPDLSIQVHLTLEQTAPFAGTFHSSILPESYVACRQAAYEALAMAFLDLLAKRLHMAGFPDATDRGTLEALVQETFGMSTFSYLTTYGPALLPTLEEFQARYDGSGTYQSADGILTWRFDSPGNALSEISECYIRKGNYLVLTQKSGPASQGHIPGTYPVVYTLQSQETQTMDPQDAEY